LKILRQDDYFDLVAIYFGGTDVLGHRFWRYMQAGLYLNKPTEKECRRLAKIIRNYYAYIDSVVGEMVEAAPADSVIFVVSDHGMEPVNTDGKFLIQSRIRDLLSAGHHNAPDAFFVACGPNIRKNDIGKPISKLTRQDLQPIGSVFDVLPTMLCLLGFPTARDMDGTVITAIIEPDYLEKHPVQLVDTYTPADWNDRRNKTSVYQAGVEERLEQLRQLGYIDEPKTQERPRESQETNQDPPANSR
jgi:arylsulfatase A-like enzyme